MSVEDWVEDFDYFVSGVEVVGQGVLSLAPGVGVEGEDGGPLVD